MSTSCVRAFSLAGLLLTLWPGCDPPVGAVTVNFSQIGGCNGWMSTSNTFVGPGGDAAFVVFKLHNIDNTKGQADFTLSPDRIYVGDESQKPIGNSGLLQLTGLKAFQETTVPKGQVATLESYAVFRVVTSDSDPATEATQTTWYPRMVMASGDPSIVFVKSDPPEPGTPVVQDCLKLPF